MSFNDNILLEPKKCRIIGQYQNRVLYKGANILLKPIPIYF